MDEKKCPCCGALLIEYKASLSKGLAKVLWKLYISDLPKRAGSGLDISFSERTNAQKLKYWKLLSMDRGFWELTILGRQFVMGNVNMPKHAYHVRGAVVRFSEEQIYFNEIAGSFLTKPEYQAIVVEQLSSNNNQKELF